MSTFAWFCAALGFVIGFQVLAIGGYEWTWWRQATLSPGFFIPQVANPPYVGILLYPLALLPLRLGILLFSLISILCLFGVHRLSGVNKWLLLASYPALRVLLYSQLDVLTIFGAALGLWAVDRRRPYLVGLAITLLAIKPQVGAALAVAYFIWARDWRVLVVPAAIALLSFVGYGFWLAKWIQHLAEFSAGHADSGLLTWPWGLLLWIPLLLMRNHYRRPQLVGAIAAANLLTAPYYQSYGALTSMAVPYPYWLYPFFTLPRFTGWPSLTIVALTIICYPLLLSVLERFRPTAQLARLLHRGESLK